MLLLRVCSYKKDVRLGNINARKIFLFFWRLNENLVWLGLFEGKSSSKDYLWKVLFLSLKASRFILFRINSTVLSGLKVTIESEAFATCAHCKDMSNCWNGISLLSSSTLVLRANGPGFELKAGLVGSSRILVRVSWTTMAYYKSVITPD